MKTANILLIVLLCGMVSGPVVGQIPNNGFEEWVKNGDHFDPVGWWTTNEVVTTGTYFPASRSLDHYPPEIGAYSLRLENKPELYPDWNAMGIAWTGQWSKRDGREDGILTAREISLLDLNGTELVVMSACETGLGRIKDLEGVYGLQRAFKLAGVRYLIMSLWQVPDYQSKDLMVTFYQYWLEEQLSIPEAFGRAQQDMKDKYRDPYFWAGFVLME